MVDMYLVVEDCDGSINESLLPYIRWNKSLLVAITIMKKSLEG